MKTALSPYEIKFAEHTPVLRRDYLSAVRTGGKQSPAKPREHRTGTGRRADRSGRSGRKAVAK